MIITHPLSGRYSETYRKRLFTHFNLFGDHRTIEALKANVQKFGPSVPVASSIESTGEVESETSVEGDSGE